MPPVGYDLTVGVGIFAILNLTLTYIALFVYRLRLWDLFGLQLVGVLAAILLIRVFAPSFSRRVRTTLGMEKETGELQQDQQGAGIVLTLMFGAQGLMIHRTRGLTAAALILPAVDFVLTLLGV